jgi:hypothetical protein
MLAARSPDIAPSCRPQVGQSLPGPPARKATGISRPIAADGTSRLSKPAAFVVPVEPETVVATHHPAVSAMTQSCRKRVDRLFTFASLIHTGSNCEMSHRSWTLSRVTRTLEVVCVGASLPIVVV